MPPPIDGAARPAIVPTSPVLLSYSQHEISARSEYASDRDHNPRSPPYLSAMAQEHRPPPQQQQQPTTCHQETAQTIRRNVQRFSVPYILPWIIDTMANVAQCPPVVGCAYVIVESVTRSLSQPATTCLPPVGHPHTQSNQLQYQYKPILGTCQPLMSIFLQKSDRNMIEVWQ